MEAVETVVAAAVAEEAAATAVLKGEKVGSPGGARKGAGVIRCATAHTFTLGRGELIYPTSGDGPSQPALPCYLQALVPVWGVLGGL